MQTIAAHARKWLLKTVGPRPYKAARNVYRRTFSLDRFLRHATGVIHVGANLGQERELYALFDLAVLWIEPIPEIFEQLQHNLSGFPKQRACQSLLTDGEGREYVFHVANNDGESSSLLEFSKHHEMWPGVNYSRDLSLSGTTLPALLASEGIDLSRYDTLVLDTQGSELLVLRGAAGILSSFRFIKTEAADFEAYKGGCTAAELTAFLGTHGFREQRRAVARATPGVGTYWDILYRH